VSVLLGNGNGTFHSAVNFGVGANPYSVAVADANGDGRPDLVTANFNGDSVSVLLGNGNGTFHSAVNFGVGSAPSSVAVADVNGDGRPDLVVANRDNTSVSVLLGKRKAATHLQITAPPSVTAGVPFTITVSALATSKGVDDLYTGTVTFTSSDGAAMLPAKYTFTERDLGVHTFTVTLDTTGSQTVTATDTVKSTITGTATVTVDAPGAPPPQAGDRSGHAATDSGNHSDDRRASALAAWLAEHGFSGATFGHTGSAAPSPPGSAIISGVDPASDALAERGQLDLAPDALALPVASSEGSLVPVGLRRRHLEAFFATDSWWRSY
jgi:hypothetical protein